ncbi:MAG: glycine/betaine/sarcosine/D-proline family reductase selenoprotein B [Chloroflexi bacterium]|nr:glycine/betaine/sarcosine/D-proline family reductase selenoprotein B [Chloroflexota bacterium]
MISVVHYLNQFFGRIGGEEAGDTPLSVADGPVGPGAGLQKELGAAAKVTATIICGDNKAAADLAAFGDEVEAHLQRLKPDVVVAGPAFNAGRYGLACGEVCLRAAKLSIPAVTALNEESPGIDVYKSKVYILPTSPTALGMTETLGRLAKFALRLAAKETIGPAETEGYHARGVRRAAFHSASAAERAVDMLLARLTGATWTTELPLPALPPVKPAPPVADLKKARIALVTTGGLVPKGNPDGVKQSNSTTWRSYSVEGKSRMEPGQYESIHGGYDNSHANANPNYVVPLDALRELEQAGVVGGVLAEYYVLAGVGTAIADSRRIGREIAADLKGKGVDAVLLTAT